jgi:colanic acid/amylovoran biosynthesis glycosyltransferase
MDDALNSHKVAVAHLRTPYLLISETFVYKSLINTERFRSIVLTMRLENEETFPFRDVYLLTVPRAIRVLWERALRFDSSVLKYAPWYPAHMRAIRQHQVRLLHAHFGTTAYFAWPLKKLHHIPLVTSFYGADVSRLGRQPCWQARYRRLFACGEQFTVTSEQMKSRLVDLGCPENRITLIGTGVDLETFTYHPRQLPGPGQAVKFLLVARFVEKKGVEYAVKAFARVHAIHPHTELRVIGDGPLRLQIERLIADLAVEDSVVLLGFQPTSVVVEETRHCHIVLQPSVTARDGDQEGGAPAAMMEAQATGMPFVATLHASIAEEVLDGETGFLVPERDVEALAERMMFLVEHPELWNEMGYKARKHIEQHYSEQILSARLEKVYEQAIKDHGPCRSVPVPVKPHMGDSQACGR